jgi:ABC-type polysaccharide/polyol phosphate transport system ATPase subunit
MDEVMTVGDLAFQEKCFQRISQFRADGCTIFLVTHDLTVVQDFCDEAMLFRAGQLVVQGKPAEVIERYTGSEIINAPQLSTEGRSVISVP